MGVNNYSGPANNLLIFLHIPKTGGTTLRGIIDKQYSSNKRWHAYEFLPLEQRIKEVPKKQLKKINYMAAHFQFGAHQYFTRPYTYVTMLRNPIKRLISEYYHRRRNPNNPLYDKLQNISLKEFVSSDEFLSNSNLQLFMIRGRAVKPFNLKHNDLEEAKKNLEKHFSVIGITEMFDESLFLMKKEFGWEDVSYTKKNVTKSHPSKEEVPKEVVKIIEERNKLDIRLYKYVKRKLKEKLKDLDPESKRELNDFIK
ncbi:MULTISPECIES: sulfotransferase family 2 domain-containing protein [unclassified Candidatus Frackibacter]|uniref:sulfotransferase family 2 domain-containing protein n=1 Tax=unclassified Candidatus Frackibacter TaxID=2648818 RepID=UPI00088D6791|nr:MULTISPECIES: sulfotransferase family 2 domain-containing protein [unclassified Candidatus Frackibacter]SDC82903.1 Sulfotransferase family protein [Candidatus Frackibacter sp. WG11]SEM97382.1 Sulfotransferase family protein [Candidatus Frackibacter sp. WG12]SFM06100.1 Sulfotransferase family protein [Candidatus Frackibacter sp. WG13]